MKESSKILAFLFCLLTGIAFTSSCTKLNVDNAGDIEYDTSLGLPIGSIKADVSNVLESISIDEIEQDTTNNTLSLNLNLPSEKIDFNYSDFSFGANATSNINLREIEPFKTFYDNLPTIPGVDNNDITFPVPESTSVMFSEDITYDPYYNRDHEDGETISLDSMLIGTADFNFNITASDLNVSPSNPLDVTIQFRSITDENQNEISSTLTSTNQIVSHRIQNVKLVFPEGTNNIPIDIIFTVPQGSNLNISGHAKLTVQTQLLISGLEMSWGNFASDNPVFEDRIKMEIPTDIFENPIIKNSKFFFSNPQVDIKITNRLGIPILAKCDSIYAVGEDGETRYASFNGKTYFEQRIKQAAEYGDSTVCKVQLDKDNGGTNRLFEIIPKNLFYKWEAGLAAPLDEENEVHFIPKETSLSVEMNANLPFQMNAKSEIFYSDSLEFDLEALVGEIAADIDVNDLAITLDIQNRLPFKTDLEASLIDDNNNVLFTRNDINIQSATVDAEGRATTASKQRINLIFEESELENILSTKKIDFVIDLTGMDENSKIMLQLDDYIQVKIGLFVNAGINTDILNTNK